MSTRSRNSNRNYRPDRWDWFNKFSPFVPFTSTKRSTSPVRRREDVHSQQQHLDPKCDIHGRTNIEAGYRTTIGHSGARPTPAGTPTSGFNWDPSSFGRPCHQVCIIHLAFPIVCLISRQVADASGWGREG